MYFGACFKKNSSLHISHFKRSANPKNSINLPQKISHDFFCSFRQKIIFIPPNFRMTFFGLQLYTPYKGEWNNWSVTSLKYDKYLSTLFNCNCLFRPLVKQSLLQKQPFITAHFKSSLHIICASLHVKTSPRVFDHLSRI